ncbi:MAG: DNA polymerase IV [Ignavibacteriales bacterium]|nr:DNA polymerase IV [Ignavibacteriales bacterium]
MEPVATRRHIAHIDLDCFYVSVERIKNPSLIGKPVVVGGSPTGRGVVASASYEAREFGVHSAMPAARALKLCPQLIMVHGHYSEYSEYSDRIYKRMQEFSPVVERASIDELYMDFTGCESLYNNDLPGLMQTLHKLVWQEFTLPCTIALAANKVVAKIAAGTVKPNGVIHVPHGSEARFLAPYPIDVIPGIGKKTSEFLRMKGFQLVADIQRIALQDAVKLLGKHGVWIYNAARGRGTDTLTPEYGRKSISNEETFGHDIAEFSELEKKLFPLVESVCSSARSHRWKAHTITLKLRYSDFDTITRAESLKPTHDDAIVFEAAKRLLAKNYTRSMALRLLGVKLSNFVEESEEDLPLFASEKREPALTAVDKLRKKFGNDVIHVGGV